jgi:phage baseplate assembly protein W
MTLDRLGTDLALLGESARRNSRDPAEDLKTRTRRESGGADLVDLRPVSGSANLSQALLLRLITAQGELAELGHPDYGSRLPSLIGEPNVERTRALARLYVLQALTAEPRVRQVLALTVTVPQGRPDDLDITAQVSVAGVESPLNLVFPFSLAGGAR